ncbi:hypothetical protein TNIN_231331 [Trichonephila inaurata madagascariensis]|uniref:Uncharacterized protein n=1 Tax=Trichonephila inaurata madagascariensis TaxID=2747483 RepID=A0A8X7C938_9ARAC|nr:hypothetical protein TNIN_231331 [Trichonephila inaurata madagascariensis]
MEFTATEKMVSMKFSDLINLDELTYSFLCCPSLSVQINRAQPLAKSHAELMRKLHKKRMLDKTNGKKESNLIESTASEVVLNNLVRSSCNRKAGLNRMEIQYTKNVPFFRFLLFAKLPK